MYAQHRQDTVPTNTVGPKVVEFSNGEPGHKANCMVFSNFDC